GQGEGAAGAPAPGALAAGGARLCAADDGVVSGPRRAPRRWPGLAHLRVVRSRDPAQRAADDAREAARRGAAVLLPAVLPVLPGGDALAGGRGHLGTGRPAA